jgi:hypothetical protein
MFVAFVPALRAQPIFVVVLGPSAKADIRRRTIHAFR